MLRILCCSDTHGKPPPENDDGGAAAWLFAGDAYEQTSAVDQAKAQQAIRRWLDGRSIPIYAIRGNHDKADPADFFANGRDVTGQVRKIATGLWVAGVGWFGNNPYDSPGEANLERLCDDIRRQAARSVLPPDRLILLTHYPALARGLFPAAGYAVGGVLDCIRRLIEELKPVAVVQGHVHEWFGTSAVLSHSWGSVLIVNPGPQGAVVCVDTQTGQTSCEFLAGNPQ